MASESGLPEGEAERRERPAGRRRQASERRRRRILEAAREVFGRHGFAGARVEAIAAAAGVSNGLLYQFFRNKEHLFEVVVEELFRDWRKALLPAVEHHGEGDRYGRLIEELLRGSVDFARRHPLLPAILSEDAIHELSRFSDLGGRWAEGHREHVAGWLRAGVASGEFREDLDIPASADLVCQLQHAYSSRAYRPRRGEEPTTPELVDGLVAFVLAALRA